MEQILSRIAKLISVKSIVTILLAVIFAVLSVRGNISGNEFLTVFSVVIAFYFGTQTAKSTTKSDDE
jgi:galactitol-specific phosphotransferase system IIC component